MTMIGALIAYVIQVGTMRRWLLLFATFPLMFFGYLGRDVFLMGVTSDGQKSMVAQVIYSVDQTIQFSFLMIGLVALAWVFNAQWSKKEKAQK